MGKVNIKSESFKVTKETARSSIDKVRANLQKVIDQVQGEVGLSLGEVAKSIATRSNELAPLKDDELRPSQYVISDIKDDQIVYEIGYTDTKAPYVHENTPNKTDYVNPTTLGTHWKFLETAVTEEEDNILSKLQADIK